MSELPEMSTLKILIVEDSKVVYKELKYAIENKLGCIVDVITTFADVQRYLNEKGQEVFLAVVDLHLPGSPNGEVVDLFCSKSIPTIVFTSDFSEETRVRMMSKDIVDYIVKDARAVDDVVSYVNRLIRNRNVKVLVVDDSSFFRMHLCSLLKKQMFQVLDVSDAESAVELLSRVDDIAMVVVDYELPKMNGLALTREIRRRYKKDEVVIIGISALGPELTVRFFKTGANDFIPKPFEAEEFFSRVNHNIEMIEVLRAFKEADKLKNQFLGMAVHDLRSPINGINGLSEMLLDDMCGPLSDEQREIMGYIFGANKLMNSLVSDLLDISVIESGQLELLKEEANFEELLEDQIRLHSISASKKSISIEPVYSYVPSFNFDSRRISQVTANLLSNAIKFSPTDTRIEVILSREEDQARVCVRDQGQGVPPDEEKLLFQSFKKTSVKPTAGESSTGLGLLIAKKIVEAHGGTIWVDSTYAEGACFCFEIPIN